MGHLRLAKQLVAGMRRGEAVGSSVVAEASGAEGAEGAEGDRGALGALEEEVDLSIFATELAVQYLGTLATLHGALTGSRELALAPTELTGLVRSAAAVVRPQLQPGVELRVEVPEAKTYAVTDELMLMQVLRSSCPRTHQPHSLSLALAFALPPPALVLLPLPPTCRWLSPGACEFDAECGALHQAGLRVRALQRGASTGRRTHCQVCRA